jgi:hypothetical protein
MSSALTRTDKQLGCTVVYREGMLPFPYRVFYLLHFAIPMIENGVA